MACTCSPTSNTPSQDVAPAGFTEEGVVRLPGSTGTARARALLFGRVAGG